MFLFHLFPVHSLWSLNKKIKHFITKFILNVKGHSAKVKYQKQLIQLKKCLKNFKYILPNRSFWLQNPRGD